MTKMNALTLPSFSILPGPVYFRHDEFGAGSHAAPHRHEWGQLNYVAHGVMQLEIAGQRFLSPPQYAVWIPPDAEHSCYNRSAIVYRSLYLARELCAQLPQTGCSLTISPIMKAILSDFAERQLHLPQSAADQRLVDVLLDQLAQARISQQFLPLASQPALQQVLAALQANPADQRSLAAWAQQVHCTERTLARHCQRELGMSLGEWRQRLRFLQAIEALNSGHTVQQIAFDLGYSTASAFIAMFQRMAGMTPEQYRRTGH